MISIWKFYFLTNVHLKVMDLLMLGTLVIEHELILTGWEKLVNLGHQTVWKVNVWCSIIGSQIVDPAFFDENLNGDRYSALIVTNLFVLLENLPLQLRLNMWYPTGCMSVAYIETCSCGIKCYVSQQVDRQIRSDQLFTPITRSYRPWLLFLGKDKRLGLSRTIGLRETIWFVE